MTLKEKLDKINYPKVRTLQNGHVSTIEEFWHAVVSPYLPDKKTMFGWHKLLMEYVNSEFPTLAIRAYYSAPQEKYDTLRRGFLTRTPYYKFFYTDNYFAAYFLKMSMDGYVPNFDEFREMMNNRTFPLRFGQITSKEKEMMSFKQGHDPGIHKAGFKLAHIIPVGMDYYVGQEVMNLTRILDKYFFRGEREDYLKRTEDGEEYFERYLDADRAAEQMLIAHFIRFVHPLNYFACPNDRSSINNKCKRLAEYQPLLDYAHDYLYNIYGDIYVEFAQYALAGSKYRTPHISCGNDSIDITYGLNMNLVNIKLSSDGKEISAELVAQFKDLIKSCVSFLNEQENYGAGILHHLTETHYTHIIFGTNYPLLTLNPYAVKAKYTTEPIINDTYYLYDDWDIFAIKHSLEKLPSLFDQLKEMKESR